MIRCRIWIVSSLAGTSVSSATTRERGAAPAVQPGIGRRRRPRAARVPARDGAEIAGRRRMRRTAGAAAGRSRAPRRCCARTAGVRRRSGDTRCARRARRDRLDVHLPRALDALQREQQLPFTCRTRQALRRRGGSGRDCGNPSGRTRPAGSRCSTCSTRLTLSKNSLQSNVEIRRRLPIRLAIAACSAAWCCPSARIASSIVCPRAASACIELALQRRADGAVARATRCSRRVTNAVMDLSRPLVAARRGVGLERATPADPPRCGARGLRPSTSARTRRCSSSASFSALGHAHSSPIVSGVTDWKARDEPLQPLRVETAGAGSDQLERQRIDARQPGEFVGGDARQPPEERRRQIVMDVARGGRDDVEVVEQPFGGRRHRLAARIVRERRVHARAARACARAAGAGARGRRHAAGAIVNERRQPAGVLLEQLETQQFFAARQRARSREDGRPHELDLSRVAVRGHRAWYTVGAGAHRIA